jgi:hypothetical protein
LICLTRGPRVSSNLPGFVFIRKWHAAPTWDVTCQITNFDKETPQLWTVVFSGPGIVWSSGQTFRAFMHLHPNLSLDLLRENLLNLLHHRIADLIGACFPT